MAERRCEECGRGIGTEKRYGVWLCHRCYGKEEKFLNADPVLKARWGWMRRK